MSAGNLPPLPKMDVGYNENLGYDHLVFHPTGYSESAIKAHGQASRKAERAEIITELEGMKCNNATARSAIRACIETIKEMA